MTDREVRDFIGAINVGIDVIGTGWRYRVKGQLPLIGRIPSNKYGDAKLTVVNIYSDGMEEMIAQTAYRSDLIGLLIAGDASLACVVRKGVQ
jgi:hypothetical protein